MPATRALLQASLRPRFDGRFTLYDGGHPIRIAIDLAAAAAGRWDLPDGLAVRSDSGGGGNPPAQHARRVGSVGRQLDPHRARGRDRRLPQRCRAAKGGRQPSPPWLRDPCRRRSGRRQTGEALVSGRIVPRRALRVHAADGQRRGRRGDAGPAAGKRGPAQAVGHADHRGSAGAVLCQTDNRRREVRTPSWCRRCRMHGPPQSWCRWRMRRRPAPCCRSSCAIRLARAEGVVFVHGENWTDAAADSLRSLAAFYGVVPAQLRVDGTVTAAVGAGGGGVGSREGKAPAAARPRHGRTFPPVATRAARRAGARRRHGLRVAHRGV